MAHQYLVNEVYYTIHGEGVRVGIPHVFIRLAQCNLTCGFCDTEFESFGKFTAAQLVEMATEEADRVLAVITDDVVDDAKVITGTANHMPCRNVLFCGGEPLLQLDDELVAAFKPDWHISVETNGTKKCPDNVDWITCSPKVAEHAIRLERAHELKYVRGYKMNVPRPKIEADHYLISPMFEANEVDKRTMEWCIQLVKENPVWRLTCQTQKFWNVR